MMTHLCTCPGKVAASLKLPKKRNRSTETPCKSCGGIFSVDGTGTISPNMPKKGRLEVTSAINPELSWKKLAKGRRSRKPVARSMDGGANSDNKSPKRVGDSSGSDSDKFGLENLQQFPSDKAVHVPIKKRRHLLQSLQPPESPLNLEGSLTMQTRTSVLAEDFKPPSDLDISVENRSSNCLLNLKLKGSGKSAAVTNDNMKTDVQSSEHTKGNFYKSVDFSGIALLAAAACDASMDSDFNSFSNDDTMKEPSEPVGPGALMSVPVKENVFLERSTDSSFVEGVHQEKEHCLLSATDGHCERKKDTAGWESAYLNVDRLHWDLNVPMESWGHTLGDPVATSTSERRSGSGMPGGKVEVVVEGKQKDINELQLHMQNHTVLRPLETLVKLSSPKIEGKSEELSGIDIKGNVRPSVSTASKVVIADISKDMLHGATLGKSDFDGIVSDDNLHGDYSCRKVLALNKAFEDIIQVREQKIALPELQVLEVTNQNDIQQEGAEGFVKPAEFPDYLTSPREMIGKDTSDLSHERDLSHPLLQLENPSVPGASRRDQSIVISDVKVQDGIVSADDTHTTTLRVQSEFGKLASQCSEGPQSNDPSSSSAKMGSTLEDCHNSDDSQGNRDNMARTKDMTELQGGYDSPYEDGEVRGSYFYSWEENGIEDVVNQHMDYESDGIDREHSDAADRSRSEILDAGSEGSHGIDKRNSSATKLQETGLGKIRSPRSPFRRQMKRDKAEENDIRRSGEFNVGSGITGQQPVDITGNNNDDNVRRRHTSNPTEEWADVTRGKLQSRIEGSVSVDGKYSTEGPWRQTRYHNFGNSYLRPKRDTSPGKFSVRHDPASHARGRNEEDNPWSRWNSRNHFSSSFHAPKGHSHSRLRSEVAESVDKLDGLDSSDQRQPVNYSSEAQDRLYDRRSSVDRDDFYGGHRRFLRGRGRGRGFGNNRGRGNGSFSYYSQGGRGFREKYLEPDSDDADRVPHHLPSRERISPPGRGFLHRRRSRSRSRTQSPRPWQSQRERIPGARRQSKSPDPRSESRPDRMRIPFQKPSFMNDYGNRFRSPRGRFSPQRGCFSLQRGRRWVDERSFEDSHSRSPPRGLRFRPKFDSSGSSGRLKSDDYFDPMIRPRIFPGRRPYKFEDDDEEMRRGENHNPSGGRVSRFEDDDEERRRGDNCDVPGGGRTSMFEDNYENRRANNRGMSRDGYVLKFEDNYKARRGNALSGGLASKREDNNDDRRGDMVNGGVTFRFEDNYEDRRGDVRDASDKGVRSKSENYEDRRTSEMARQLQRADNGANTKRLGHGPEDCSKAGNFKKKDGDWTSGLTDATKMAGEA